MRAALVVHCVAVLWVNDGVGVCLDMYHTAPLLVSHSKAFNTFGTFDTFGTFNAFGIFLS
jgi:hypothetical protein